MLLAHLSPLRCEVQRHGCGSSEVRAVPKPWYLKTEEEDWILKSQILKEVGKVSSGMRMEKNMPGTQHCSYA
jgi:hypothetical protein